MPPRERSRSPRGRAAVIDGRQIAAALCEDVRVASCELQQKHGILPCICVIEVGNHDYGQLLDVFEDLRGPTTVVERSLHPGQSRSSNYADLKAKMAEKCGMRSQVVRFSENVSQDRLLRLIERLCDDPEVHGIVVELPLPSHLDEKKVLGAIHPSKDVDGFSAANLGRLYTYGGPEPLAIPAVSAGILELLLRSKVALSGKECVVLGRSNTVGLPIANLLLQHNCTVTTCHSQTVRVEDHVRRADILVACAGRPELVRGSWLKPGAVVIDVGMNAVVGDGNKGKLVGDVHYAEAVQVAGMITAVPGGMGHISFAMLLRNALNLARQSLSLTKIGVGPAGPEPFRCADELLFPDIGLKVPTVLLPRSGLDLTKWAVVACDQYTSEPAYWQQVKELVGPDPSTLDLIFPEVYLGDKQHNQLIIQAIKHKMYEYNRDRILVPQNPGFVLLDRKTPVAESRKGLIVSLDLELYSFQKGSQSLIRATEKTIPERLPPRIAIREQSPLELPHILVLIDDPERTVIEPLFSVCEQAGNQKLYDFELMKGSGHMTGWHIASRDSVDGVAGALRNLASRERFEQRYGASPKDGTLLFPVGDGNHSLATAKSCWEDLKRRGADPGSHPARYCLIELVNIHDEGLAFEPIHRLVEHVDVQQAFQAMKQCFDAKGWGPVRFEPGRKLKGDEFKGPEHYIEVRSQQLSGVLVIPAPALILAAATLTHWLDPYLAATPSAAVDYVHGHEVIDAKVKEDRGTLGLLLPSMDKHALVRTVVHEGVLPRKTFSMGHADEKRFYMESQRIVPDPAFFKSDFFRRGSVSGPLRARASSGMADPTSPRK